MAYLNHPPGTLPGATVPFVHTRRKVYGKLGQTRFRHPMGGIVKAEGLAGAPNARMRSSPSGWGRVGDPSMVLRAGNSPSPSSEDSA